MSQPPPPPMEALLVNTAFVRRVARAVLGSDDRVEDVIQETWLVAMRTGPEQPSALRAWLGRVARNLALRVRNQDAARRRREEAAARPEVPAPIDALVEHERARRRLVDAVLALEEPYRMVMLLRYHQGLSARKVASMLGVPVETVRTRIKRGVARVRVLVEPDDDRDRGSAHLALLSLASARPLATTVAGLGAGAFTMKKIGVAAAVLILLGGAITGGILGFVGDDEREPDPAPMTADAAPGPAAGATLAPRAGNDEPDAREADPKPPSKPKAVAGFRCVITVVDDVTERPVKDALVTLCHEHARIDTEPSGTTDAEGRIVLVLPKRREADCCMVQTADYAPMVHSIYREFDHKKPGDEVTIGPLRLLRGTSIRGRVLTQDGRSAVPDAELFLSSHRSSGDFGFAHYEMQRRANDTGHFHLERVRPCPVGNWFLYAVSPTSVGWVEMPGSIGRSDLDDVEIRLQPTAAVTVHVHDEEGRPIAGALVQAQPHFEPMRTRRWHGSSPPRWFMGFRTSDRTQALFEGKADTGGQRHFPSVPVLETPSSYRASASAAGVLPSLSEAFELKPGDHHEVTLTLRRATTVTIKGIVTTRTGAPLEGAGILLNGTEVTKTGADGRFEAPDVDRRHGWTQLAVDAEGYAKTYRRQPLPPVGEPEEVRIELWPVRPLSGRVVDQHGDPIKGAYVDLIRTGGDVPAQSSVRTDASGVFLLASATEHEFSLRVIPPQPYWEWKRREGGYPIVRGGQSGVVVTLERIGRGKARVTAAVRDSATGAALDATDAMLIRKDDGSGIQTPQRTIESGRIVVDGVHPGRYLLWVRTAGRLAAWKEIEVAETDGDVRTEVRVLAKADLGVVRGTVDLGGAARPSFIVVSSNLTDVWTRPQWANDQGARVNGFSRVGKDWTFELKDLVPGRHTVSLSSSGWLGSVEVDVEPGGTSTATVVGRRAGVLRLVAKPIPEGTATVRFLTSKDGEAWQFRMNLGVKAGGTADQKITLEPGRWRWKVVFDADNIAGGSRTSAETQTGVVDTVAGETTRVEVPVKPRGR